jgi:hypothetical protein
MVNFPSSPSSRAGSDSGLVIARAAASGERDGGEQPGPGLEGHVPFEAFLVARAVLVDVPRAGIDDRHHPVLSCAPGDPPPPVGPVGVPGRLHVLPGDQGQQPGGILALLAELLPGQVPQQIQRIGDQGTAKAARAASSSRAIFGLPGSA